MSDKRNLTEDVLHIITAECRARACSTRTTDRVSPILTGHRAATLPRHIRRDVAGSNGAKRRLAPGSSSGLG
jgi:hypothetical protein